MNIRETFTYFKFDQHIKAVGPGLTATQTGTTVDRQGFDSLTFLIHVAQVSAATSTGVSYWFVRMQHTDASALGAGPSDFADCASIDMIRPLSGAVTSGIFALNTDTMSGTVQKLGYRGNKQYVRLMLSMVTMTMGASNVIDAFSMLGHAENWPVTVPNLDA